MKNFFIIMTLFFATFSANAQSSENCNCNCSEIEGISAPFSKYETLTGVHLECSDVVMTSHLEGEQNGERRYLVKVSSSDGNGFSFRITCYTYWNGPWPAIRCITFNGGDIHEEKCALCPISTLSH